MYFRGVEGGGGGLLNLFFNFIGFLKPFVKLNAGEREGAQLPRRF